MELLLTRTAFREGVFARDKLRCVFCKEPGQDAHHILERRLFSDFGYYLSNGATVCGPCHLACERTIYSVEDVRRAAGITKPTIPEHLYPDHIYDKWGNPILEDGRRAKGELFYDESVQKALAEGGVLQLFTPYVKYGRTFHVPWSPGIHDDDKALTDCSQFEGEDIVASLKMDGENTSGYSDGHVHARSIDSRGGEDRAWVKRFLIENVCFNLPPGWRICGENLWAKHSIHYEALPSYFQGFSIWNELGECLSWNETKEWFQLLGVTPVPVLYEGPFSERVLHEIESKLSWDKDEGYVVRLARGFKQSEFRRSVAKYVRAGHVQTTSHWRAGQRFTPNGLVKE